ncbi:uncharacterized protein EAE97_003698 [Botrytis byssoidea]|uniref:Uncharacterized protein n=1 Tax=Botrytis byssoidea TaxID=139641 RepID=A0A9P5M7X4_9HELO|nr:uncharacterized protein EAE97_003698 [Botrytis byssoidea]KAF7948287.1 hypothetical protein EAE97_003698 [Botrytis byssoidea]
MPVTNELKVKLTFFHRESHVSPDAIPSPNFVGNAVNDLWDMEACAWSLKRSDDIQDPISGGRQVCLTLRHNNIRANDRVAEQAISNLCTYLFEESSVITLDELLGRQNLVMAPFKGDEMSETDKLFGRYFSMEHLKQLNNTGGAGFVWQDTVQKTDRPITRNLSKWFHAPLYAGLCVTNFFVFFETTFQGFSSENFEKMASLSDPEMADLFERGQWILRCAKVFAAWAPQSKNKIEAQLQVLNTEDKKEALFTKTRIIKDKGSLFRSQVAFLNKRDPGALESRQICNTMAGMISDCGTLHESTLEYIDSCVASTTKDAGFTVAGIALVMGAAFVPVAGPILLAAGMAGSICGGGLIGHYGVMTAIDGVALHKSKKLKIFVREVHIALMSCRSFLLLMLWNTQQSLQSEEAHYQEFKKMISKCLGADLDRFSESGYVNTILTSMEEVINKTIAEFSAEVSNIA